MATMKKQYCHDILSFGFNRTSPCDEYFSIALLYLSQWNALHEGLDALF